MNANVGVFQQYYALCFVDATYCGGPATRLKHLQMLDELIDDGDPATGRLRKYSGVHYHYIVEFK